MLTEAFLLELNCSSDSLLVNINLCMHLALSNYRKNRTNINNLFSIMYKFPEAKLNYAHQLWVCDAYPTL